MNKRLWLTALVVLVTVTGFGNVFAATNSANKPTLGYPEGKTKAQKRCRGILKVYSESGCDASGFVNEIGRLQGRASAHDQDALYNRLVQYLVPKKDRFPELDKKMIGDALAKLKTTLGGKLQGDLLRVCDEWGKVETAPTPKPTTAATLSEAVAGASATATAPPAIPAPAPVPLATSSPTDSITTSCSPAAAHATAYIGGVSVNPKEMPLPPSPTSSPVASTPSGAGVAPTGESFEAAFALKKSERIIVPKNTCDDLDEGLEVDAVGVRSENTQAVGMAVFKHNNKWYYLFVSSMNIREINDSSLSSLVSSLCDYPAFFTDSTLAKYAIEPTKASGVPGGGVGALATPQRAIPAPAPVALTPDEGQEEALGGTGSGVAPNAHDSISFLSEPGAGTGTSDSRRNSLPKSPPPPLLRPSPPPLSITCFDSPVFTEKKQWPASVFDADAEEGLMADVLPCKNAGVVARVTNSENGKHSYFHARVVEGCFIKSPLREEDFEDYSRSTTFDGALVAAKDAETKLIADLPPLLDDDSDSVVGVRGVFNDSDSDSADPSFEDMWGENESEVPVAPVGAPVTFPSDLSEVVRVSKFIASMGGIEGLRNLLTNHAQNGKEEGATTEQKDVRLSIDDEINLIELLGAKEVANKNMMALPFVLPEKTRQLLLLAQPNEGEDALVWRMGCVLNSNHNPSRLKILPEKVVSPEVVMENMDKIRTLQKSETKVLWPVGVQIGGSGGLLELATVAQIPVAEGLNPQSDPNTPPPSVDDALKNLVKSAKTANSDADSVASSHSSVSAGSKDGADFVKEVTASSSGTGAAAIPQTVAAGTTAALDSEVSLKGEDSGIDKSTGAKTTPAQDKTKIHNVRLALWVASFVAGCTSIGLGIKDLIALSKKDVPASKRDKLRAGSLWKIGLGVALQLANIMVLARDGLTTQVKG